MSMLSRSPLRFASAFVLLSLLAAAPPLQAQEKQPDAIKGLRVFSTGHSFHFFVPPILTDIAKKANVDGHVPVGLSAIGGSRVIQHWNVADDKNKAKEALKAGKVDVLTLSPIHLPDDGIENFAKLAFEHNPKIRVTVQENWLPFDIYDTTFKQRPDKVDHNAHTGPELRMLHAPYFKDMEAHVVELNKKLGKDVLFIVPGRPGGHRPAREDHRGRGAGPEDAERPVHRPDRPRPAAAGSPGRLLLLRVDLPAQPRRPADARGAGIDEERRPEPAAAGDRLAGRQHPSAERRES